MTLTPMMKQYQEIKEKYPQALLFFRLGDFYEMFFDDALIASKILDITLTARDGGAKKVPMCGVPYHSVEPYIDKLVSNGYKIAICEQMEDPKQAKGIVKRQVTRVITPGTVMSGQMLEDKKNNYLASILAIHDMIGLAYTDITTGEFTLTEFSAINKALFWDEISRLQPSEMLLMANMPIETTKKLNELGINDITFINEMEYDHQISLSHLYKQFSEEAILNLKIPAISLCLTAAGILVNYLIKTQMRSLDQIKGINYHDVIQYMQIDMTARRNLELIRTLVTDSKKGSLLSIIDYTDTAMGGRTMKKWLEQPLINVGKINQRLDAVGELKENIFMRTDLHALLKEVYDMERLTARAAYGTANGKDLIALKNSLIVLPNLKEIISTCSSNLLKLLANELDDLTDIALLLTKSIKIDPPFSVREGGIIKEGFSTEIDELRDASANGRKWLAQLETKEKERTGIKSLKIRFNKVFGYYIEITKSNLASVPSDYQRRQTLSNAERFITPELKKYEETILGAEEKLVELEYRAFIQVRNQVAGEIDRIQKTANMIAAIDALLSLAEVAHKNNYIRPNITEEIKLNIVEGRHPVVDAFLLEGQFVPNDTDLNAQDQFIALITGPNMGGKSTYQRQVALICILAQMGSFVPAKKATVGIVDRIFARIGASDNLASGQSTFMMEMQECNHALSSATAKSLVVIDELGRGTSNLEGMAIAQAVIEYLHDKKKCRTLFSTHYHELGELEKTLLGLKNYAAAVEEKGDEIVFLHKIIKSKASKSYGVHCARLAGMPKLITDRANNLVKNYSAEGKSTEIFTPPPENNEEQPLLAEICSLDLLQTTPFGALTILYNLQKEAQKLIKK